MHAISKKYVSRVGLLFAGTVVGALLAIISPALILPVGLLLLGWGYVRHDWYLPGLWLVSFSVGITLFIGAAFIYLLLVYPGSDLNLMTGPTLPYPLACMVGCGLLWRARRRPIAGTLARI